jgi:hypothetical protein
MLLVPELEHWRWFLVLDGADGGDGEADKSENFCKCSANGGVECDALVVMLVMVACRGGEGICMVRGRVYEPALRKQRDTEIARC